MLPVCAIPSTNNGNNGRHLKIPTFSFHKITTKTLKCLPYILISHITSLSQRFSKSFSSPLNALETVNQAEINNEQQNGGIIFQTREVQQGIPRNLGTNPYMSPYVEMVSCGEFFSQKYFRRAHRNPQKFIFS